MNFDFQKIIKKINLKKAAFAVGGVLLLIIMYLYVRGAIKKWQDQKKTNEYVRTVESSVNSANLTFKDHEYTDIANAIEMYLSDNTWSGWAGVDEDSIYVEMSKLNTIDDLNKVIAKFGTRTLRRRWHTATGEYTLPQAFSFFLDLDERTEINNRLAAKGINYQF